MCASISSIHGSKDVDIPFVLDELALSQLLDLLTELSQTRRGLCHARCTIRKEGFIGRNEVGSRELGGLSGIEDASHCRIGDEVATTKNVLKLGWRNLEAVVEIRSK